MPFIFVLVAPTGCCKMSNVEKSESSNAANLDDDVAVDDGHDRTITSTSADIAQDNEAEPAKNDPPETDKVVEAEAENEEDKKASLVLSESELQQMHFPKNFDDYVRKYLPSSSLGVCCVFVSLLAC